MRCGWTVFSDLLGFIPLCGAPAARCGWTVFSDLLGSDMTALLEGLRLRLDRLL